MPGALRFLILTAAGWVNRHQEDVIDYLREENRVLREHVGGELLLSPQSVKIIKFGDPGSGR